MLRLPLSIAVLLSMALSLMLMAQSASAESKSAVPVQITSPKVWLQHTKEQLAPFWLQEEAQGVPPGNFPTFRCNDGKLFDPAAACDELANASESMKPFLGHRFTRMQSRQTFAYGAIFHLTGDLAALSLAKAGVDHLRATLIEPSGSVISVTVDGKAKYSAEQRTTQDLAYAQLGMAFYYYLSGDEAVLNDLLRVKQHIFEHYWDDANKRLRWVREPSDQAKGTEIELVAQLDQLNAYMLLLTPLLPEPHKSEWQSDIATLLNTMHKQFLRLDSPRFYGTLDSGSGDGANRTGENFRLDTARHNDYGHTVKAWWISWLAAEYLGDISLARYSKQGLQSTLELAYLKEGSGGWQRLSDGSPAIWWEYAELDQAAASLALVDPSAQTYLNTTYPQWFEQFNAPDGEIYATAKGGLKSHLWKNGYHSLEHALIGYITSAALANESVRLYFAMPPDKAVNSQPYFFSGAIQSVTPISVNGPETISEIAFEAIGLKTGK